MTTTTKAVNFSKDQEAKIINAFSVEIPTAEAQREIVKSLAEELGKNVRSITAKASNLHVYKKFAPVSKTGAKVESKDDIVNDIEALCGDGAGDLSSLTNATKQALLAVRKALS